MSARAVIGSERLGRTPRGLLARVGRVVLWAVVVIALVRGVAGMLGNRHALAPTRVVAAAPAWPDDAARAFAVEFASAYLQQRAAGVPGASDVGLAAFAVPALADELVVRTDAHTRRLVVRSVLAAGTVGLDGRHALITVAAVLAGAPVRALRLTVPVARDAHGGLVVDDVPSLAAAPARASDAPPVGDPLPDGAERAAITDLLTRFLRAYLAGDRAGLSYLVPAGSRVAVTGGGFELVDVRSLAAVAPVLGAVRRVLVTVDVRERVSRALMVLRYRARLVRRDRWYVAELNTAGSGTR